LTFRVFLPPVPVYRLNVDVMIAFHESSFPRRDAFPKIGLNVDRRHFLSTYTMLQSE
jgi:hypothetical protein